MTRSKIRTSGAEGLTLSSTSLTVANGLTLTDGDVTLASGHGLSYAATSDATTMSSELLDDYEEGEFVAQMDNSVTLHGSADSLSYTKVGRKVTITGQIRISSSNTNDVVVNNLPFTSIDGTDNAEFGVGAVRLYEYDMPSSAKYVVCYNDTNGTRLHFVSVVDNGVIIPLDADQDGYLMFGITYFAA
jgi:hypothetical protein